MSAERLGERTGGQIREGLCGTLGCLTCILGTALRLSISETLSPLPVERTECRDPGRKEGHGGSLFL